MENKMLKYVYFTHMREIFIRLKSSKKSSLDTTKYCAKYCYVMKKTQMCEIFICSRASGRHIRDGNNWKHCCLNSTVCTMMKVD